MFRELLHDQPIPCPLDDGTWSVGYKLNQDYRKILSRIKATLQLISHFIDFFHEKYTLGVVYPFNAT